ncbi:MAG: TauD/TfdA family dioxygenase [Gemmatimonadota bacterium]|nr:TauD/TfdA family dioxygenase [Gemmatimonadota bacterium]
MTSEIKHQQITLSGFGRELIDLDISGLDDTDREMILDQYHDSGGLLLIRNQNHLPPVALCDFVSKFGRVEQNTKYNPNFLLSGHPEILKIGNVKDKGEYTALFIQADPPPLLWHTDDSFRHPQPIGSCLYCVNTPPDGGETGFAGMTAAYESLTLEMQSKVESLTAVHSYNHLNEMLRKKNPHRPPLSEELKRDLPPIKRPLVAQHPETGRKALYIPLCHIEKLVEMDENESRELLEGLLEHATQIEFVYFHKWRPGDLVIWDNRAALHAPSPFDDDKYTRFMYRLTFSGEQVVGF